MLALAAIVANSLAFVGRDVNRHPVIHTWSYKLAEVA
jgi:hypothetical protein